jgi:hypothetical protein
MPKRLLLAAAALLSLAGAASRAQDQDAILALKNRIIDLQNQGQLGFKDFALCSKVMGYGSYVPLDQPVVPAGAELLVYYEPVNVFTNRVKGQYEFWYTQDILLLAENGEVLYDQEELLSFRYPSRSPVFDLYATNSLNLGNLPPGNYTFKAVLHDKLKDAEAQFSQAFQIRK